MNNQLLQGTAEKYIFYRPYHFLKGLNENECGHEKNDSSQQDLDPLKVRHVKHCMVNYIKST